MVVDVTAFVKIITNVLPPPSPQVEVFPSASVSESSMKVARNCHNLKESGEHA